MNPSDCPVLLISLERATEKRQRAIAALEKLGLVRHQWVRAVDGGAMSAEDRALEYDPADSKKFFGTMSAAQVGCYLSHLKCHRMICEQNWPYAIIMEDDIRPMPTLLKVLAQSERFPDDWGLIHLAPGLLDRIWPCYAISYYHRQRLFDNYYVGKYLPYTFHTHLYLITPAYARKLATHLRPIRIPIDHAMFDTSYSVDYPHLIYRTANGRPLVPDTFHVGAPSEIDQINRATAPTRRARTPQPRSTSPKRPRFYRSHSLKQIVVTMILPVRHLVCRMPLANHRKTNRLHTGRARLHHLYLMMIHSCQWHMLPLVIGRYLRAWLASRGGGASTGTN